MRTVLCLEGDVEIELVCEPAFDYGRAPAEWTMEGGDRHTADATGAGQTVRLRTDMAIGIEGDRVRARHVVKQGDQVYCSLSWSEELDSPQDIDEANARMAATQRFWRGWLGRARNIDHRWRAAHPALGAGDQGSHLHADRRHRGRPHHLAARDARR